MSTLLFCVPPPGDLGAEERGKRKPEDDPNGAQQQESARQDQQQKQGNGLYHRHRQREGQFRNADEECAFPENREILLRRKRKHRKEHRRREQHAQGNKQHPAHEDEPQRGGHAFDDANVYEKEYRNCK